MEFTSLEKSAILKVLADIMLADGEIDLAEKNYLGQIFTVLELSKKETSLSTSLKVSESIAMLSRMSDAKKSALAVMMHQMMEADNDINESEMGIFLAVFAGAGIQIPKNLRK